ncbi:hypothetical protein [Chondromyces crocatus]|uniref:Uncharacterized protein n=1 Tax=Chondromyces crocatus TaxID=52 RepID=A0A0K1EDC0_CHOCO|nr:hypothetical protein [Chondromyces crocatus]AKT38682.1 uncharacterized protein CMC5_028300 [Chondromyces crocatus]
MASDTTPEPQGYAAASRDTERHAITGAFAQHCRGNLRRLRALTSRWFNRPRADNAPLPDDEPATDPYKIHWVWVGGDLAPSAQKNIVSWSRSFKKDVEPVLWVDDAALDALRNSGRIRMENGKEVLDLKGLKRPVTVTSIRTLDGAGIPGWDRLSPAIAHETQSDSGLKQVASDIVRVAVLWHAGGSYWDLGDTSPGRRRFGADKLDAALGDDAPAIIPQVLASEPIPGTTVHRTENGVILTHPRKQHEAKALYGIMLDDMAARYDRPDARTRDVDALVGEWKQRQRIRLPDNQIERDRKLAEEHPSATVLANNCAAQEHVMQGLDGVRTPKEVDSLMVEALKKRGKNDGTNTAIIQATKREDEAAYLTSLQQGLGGKIEADYLPKEISKTVNTYTFESFVKISGTQVPGGAENFPAKAENLNSAGWSKTQGFFGGNTKSGSWYSWKTVPGRTLAAEA